MEVELTREQLGKIVDSNEFFVIKKHKFTKKDERFYNDTTVKGLYRVYKGLSSYGNSRHNLVFSMVSDDLLKKIKDKILPDVSNVKFAINEWFRIKNNPDKIAFHNPKGFRTAFEAIMAKTENRLLFMKDVDDNLMPYLFEKTEYRKSYREDGTVYQASCTIHLKYMVVDKVEAKKTSVTYYSGSIKKKTVLQLLSERGIFVETPEYHEKYEKDRGLFDKYTSSIGKQFIAQGHCTKLDMGDSEYYRWYRSDSEWYKLVTSGVKPNVIIDDPSSESDQPAVTTRDLRWSYWDTDDDADESNYEDIDDADETDSDDEETDEIKPKTKKKNENVVRKNFNFAIPYHPYVICFNTLTDAHVKIHVNNLEEYKYDASLRQKLILPDDDSELLDLLCSSTQDLSEDIISGKSGGIMVLGTGIAGSGKTLTAEVFSEFMARPLYKIQSSQLGIDVKELDKRLRKILQRAIRWNAILLVDEADVYIRSRGTDIEQNAVVGVFLRLLEYFSGIIFLTSNLTDTDDAIMSRATAHIKYTYPTSDNLRKIWEILTEQYQVKITKDIVDQFCTSIDNKMVGRDVKNISKLAKIYSSKQKVIDLETLKKIAKFKDLGDKLEKK